MFSGKARSLPISGAPKSGFDRVGSPEKIRVGWKGLPGTNALAYYEKPLHSAVKSFITLAPCE
jgi:hypothetical protein